MLKYVVKAQVRAAQARNERGATAVEYGLMVGLIALGILGTVSTLGKALRDAFNAIIMDPNMGWAPHP